MRRCTLIALLVGGLIMAAPSVVGASTKPPKTADQVAKDISKALPIKVVIVYTASSDPNHLLGRPGGYSSKIAFSDARVSGASGQTVASGDIANGGSVEVFSDHAGALARGKYISAVTKAAPILGAEYDYVNGDALLRVSGLFTPTQAAQFKAALTAVMSGKKLHAVTNLGPTATTTTF